MDWSTFGSAVAGAVVGGFLAGYFSLKATQKSHENQVKHSEENEEKIISGLLQAIHDEIETVFERYQESMGARLESLDDGHGLAYYYPLVSDFFNVYNGNSFLIGRIPNNDLRKQIVKTYTLAKGMIDSYRMNNDLVSKWEFSEKLYAESQLEVHKNQAVAHYSALVDYAENLKDSHKTLKQEVSALLRELRKNGVLNEKNN
ncbi:hypothetical protein [Methylophaga sp.]|uniref:hypothetical protein n=1 Tax=Methylophaga sp. TaxID=2024840 RepID=UPI003A947433